MSDDKMGGEEAYDGATDPARDPFHPPSIPTLVYCLHCEEEYDSWKMEYRIRTDSDGKRHGFWCCGTPGCDGKGFLFDIYPVDEDFVDPDGRDMGEWIEDEPADPETDPSRPPDEVVKVRCEKCGMEFLSDEMRWEYDKETNWGEWMCCNKACSGTTFGFDIRPMDPNYVDKEGRRILKPGEKLPDPPTYDRPPRDDGQPFSDDDIPF